MHRELRSGPRRSGIRQDLGVEPRGHPRGIPEGRPGSPGDRRAAVGLAD